MVFSAVQCCSSGKQQPQVVWCRPHKPHYPGSNPRQNHNTAGFKYIFTYLWYWAWRKLNSSLIRSIESTMFSLKGPPCGPVGPPCPPGTYKKIQIYQFHEKKFGQISFFAFSKMSKNQFLNEEKDWNCQKCNFTIFFEYFPWKLIFYLIFMKNIFGLDFFNFLAHCGLGGIPKLHIFSVK